MARRSRRTRSQGGANTARGVSEAAKIMNSNLRIAILDAVPHRYLQADEGISDGEKFDDLLKAADAQLHSEIFFVSDDQSR